MPDARLLEALRRNCWIQWRKQNPTSDIDLSGADLTQVELHQINSDKGLEGANLRGARFGSLNGISFVKADLTQARFGEWSEHLMSDQFDPTLQRGAHLAFVDFSNAKLHGVRLDEAVLNFCTLNGAECYGMNAQGAKLFCCTAVGVKFGRVPRVLSDEEIAAARSRPNPSFSWIHLPSSDDAANLARIESSQTQWEGSEFCQCNLAEARLDHENLSECSFMGATLFRAKCMDTDMSRCDLRYADFNSADLRGANLSHVNARRASFGYANLSSLTVAKYSDPIPSTRQYMKVEHSFKRTRLNEAKLDQSVFMATSLVGADLTDASMVDSVVFGVSAWDVITDGTKQENLQITAPGEQVVTVDRLDVAQFIHLMLRNERLRNVIDVVAEKVVLVLGRFHVDRATSAIETIRAGLRKLGYVPIVFDFDPGAARPLRETVGLLARISRFVIADITEPMSVIDEIANNVPSLSSVPFVVVGAEGRSGWAMMNDYKVYPWFLDGGRYDTIEALAATTLPRAVASAERYVGGLGRKMPTDPTQPPRR